MSDPIRAKLTRRATLAGGVAATATLFAVSMRGGTGKIFVATTDGATLQRGNGAEPDSLDPHKIQGTWENNIVGDMFLGLMTEDAAARPVLGAAESYTVSADGLVYTFKIRDHHWSDGTPVTAHDFVFAFRRIADPKTASQYVAILYPITNMQQAAEGKLPPESVGVKALDDRTLEMTFIYQVPYLAQLLAHYASFPVPRHVVEKFGDAWIMPQNAVSNGAYRLAQWVSNDHIHLVKNPHFYARDEVAIHNVTFYPTQDASAAVKRFRGGEFDVPTDTLAPQQVQWLKAKMPREMHVHLYMLTQYLQFNLRRKPFDDIRVRRALSLAVDREIICRDVMRGGEQPAYNLVPPDMPCYPKGAELPSQLQPERSAKAKWLMSQAGFGPGNPLVFDFNTANTTEAKLVAVALQEMWREIGCKVRIAPAESQVQYDTMRKRDFAVGWAGWVADYRDPKDFLFLLQSSTSDLNYGDYRNPAYDSLIERSDRISDPAARAAILQQAEQLMLDDVPIAPVYFGVTRDLVSRQVKGWVDNNVNINRTRYLSLDRSDPIV
ncbi:MAG: peptide ABC transporter substrate-binding protein [Rhizomicrobium sp.]